MTERTERGYAKGRAKRQEILEQAAALFAEVGYRSTSLRELAARCGLSHPGLLHHFPTKESLLLAVLAERDEVDGHWLAEASSGTDALRRLTEVVALNAGRRAIVELYTTLSAEATSPEHPAHAYFVARYAAVLESVTAAFARVQAESNLRPEVDPPTAARQLLALMDGLQVQWLLDGGKTDMAAVICSFLDAQLQPGARQWSAPSAPVISQEWNRTCRPPRVGAQT
jgi:AcrR family transcriptional regulator